ncbi:MAG: DUF2147 domain-containing protein [Candidatus Syntrophosphaera sp.]|nr:DUF2147 domain-containing protein [Candidatus Syntrophosphaera sp.]
MKPILIILIALAMLLPLALLAQAHSIEGYWHNAEKTSKIQIYKTANNTYSGKIVWLKEPNNEKGKPKVDDKNPDPKLQSRELLGLVIIQGLVSKGGNKFANGTIYDPKSGNTYSSKGEVTGPNTLKLRGYIGVSLVGRTETWTRTTK